MSGVSRCAVVLIAVLVLASVSVGAPLTSPLVDSFNDGIMNPLLWTLFIDGVGPTAVEKHGFVEVVIPADAHEAEAPHSFGGGFKSAKCLRGDFNVQVDYYLLDWPEGSGIRVGLGLFPATTGQMGNVNRASYGRPEGGPTDSYAADLQGSGGGVPTTHMSGSLRLARFGNKVTAGVLVDGQWVEIHTGEFSTANYHFAFTAWGHNGSFAQKPVRVGFDNLVIRYGELVNPSDPPADAVSRRLQVMPPKPGAVGFASYPSIVMPHGLPFYRMPEPPAGSVPSKCGPYSRLKISLPSQGSGVKPLSGK